jgi:flagellar basal-body rod modification protein FlgD
VSADFETFLKMLTAQIQNQDPMNPIDSSDYATQLATFSSVEQQVLANCYLENIKSVLSNSSLASVADWIGKSAKVEGKLWFDGDPVKLEFELPFEATRAELVVQTQTGNEVFRANVDPEDRTLHWSGTQSNGANVEHGSYKAILVPYNEDDPCKICLFTVSKTDRDRAGQWCCNVNLRKW